MAGARLLLLGLVPILGASAFAPPPQQLPKTHHGGASSAARWAACAPPMRTGGRRSPGCALAARMCEAEEGREEGGAHPLARRPVLLLMLAQAAALSAVGAGEARAASFVEPEGLRAAIYELIRAEKGPLRVSDDGPLFVRLAWHSSGTYDKFTRTGGSGKGTIRFKEELQHEANAGLDKAVKKLESIKEKYPHVSYADIYTLAGAVGVEAMGGPKIPWRGGRVDSMDPKEVTADGRLPDADKGSEMKTLGHLRKVFGRMGFSDQELVALSGAHCLGRAHKEDSGYDGAWYGPNPTRFSNLYFDLLLHPTQESDSKWEPETVKSTGKVQFKPSMKDGQAQPDKFMLPSDVALLADPSLRKWVEVYARRQDIFFEDFSKAFGKLLELGRD
mmetsp:Transcript_43192/g.105677  ORF Transcript_43192/g.105677 Transcript_43192/m.105677 type:complete len:389 (-) Transcript_43192:210-1376(-)